MSVTHKIVARTLLSVPKEQLWDKLYGNIELIDDEGTSIICKDREVIANRYFWDLHIDYHELPLLSRHFLVNNYTNGVYTSKTHADLLTAVLRDIVYLVLKDNASPSTIEPILRKCVVIVNVFYNVVVNNLQEFHTSVDITDYTELLAIPEIRKSCLALDENPTAETLKIHNDNVTDLLMNNPDYKNNNLVRTVRAGSVNKNQVLQCVGARGFCTEIDSTTFKIPVSRGFAKGLTNIFDLASESRSGAKALYFSDSALKDSEYFARRLQLLTMSLMKIEHGDCGSEEYFMWNVGGPVYNNSVMVYKGDLAYIKGKRYLDPETGKLKTISSNEDDLHLIGKTIKLRSPFHCKHKDKATVCSTCFGDLSYNIPGHSNIGHLASVSMTQQITQSVLSTKHLDFSVIVTRLILSNIKAKYLKLGRGGNSYAIKKEIKRKGLKLLVSETELTGLADVYMTDDIAKLTPSRICKITTIILEVDTKEGLIKVPLDVYKDNRRAVFTFEFMQHIKETGYTTDDFGNIVFDLETWGNNTFLDLPSMQYSYSEHGAKIARIIEQTVNNLGDGKTKLTPDFVTTELFDLVNSKLNVNIAMLEIIVYAATVADIFNGNYDLSRDYENPELYNGTNIIQNRSMSASLGFRSICARMLDPSSFSGANRPNHALDCLFTPEAVRLDKTRDH